MISTILRTASAAAIVATFAGPLAAEERPHAPNLPGVEEGYRIVDEEALSAIPEAEPDQLPNGPGNFRVGNWDVTISGEVSLTIGTGVPRDGR